jgi:hypothetical protein
LNNAIELRTRIDCDRAVILHNFRVLRPHSTWIRLWQQFDENLPSQERDRGNGIGGNVAFAGSDRVIRPIQSIG